MQKSKKSNAKISDYSHSPRFKFARYISKILSHHPFFISPEKQFIFMRFLLPSPKGSCIVPTINNLKILIQPTVDSGSSIRGSVDRYVYYFGVYEIAIIDFLEHFLKKNSIFIDVGAYLGDTTIFASKIANKGLVLAFEPFPDLFKILKANAKGNNFTNIEFYKFALGSKNNLVTLYKHPKRMAMNSIVKMQKEIYTHTISEQVKTLDNVLSIRKLGRKVDVIKIDVEGYELEVLKGALKTIKKDNPILIVEHDFTRKSAKKVFDFIRNQTIYHITIPKKGRHIIGKLKEISLYDELPTDYVTNMICVPKSRLNSNLVTMIEK